MSVTVSIVGASGYTGGELLRLLSTHPDVTFGQVTSESNAGNNIHAVHPNLRKVVNLQFVSAAALKPADVLFLALPHGEAQKRIAQYSGMARVIIDLSADFRLHDLAQYQHYYGETHAAPEWVERFVYGLPELHRDALKSAQYASGVGCNATASNLALLPLVRAGLITSESSIASTGELSGGSSAGSTRESSVRLTRGSKVTVDLKVGSSESGASASASSHHPERSGVLRTFAAVGHRHEAEVRQALGMDVYLTITSVEAVRGVLATAQTWIAPGMEEKDLWKAYRAAYNSEPFVRIVHEKSGIHRHPEPKWLAGTNYADVGWEYQPETGRLVALAAIDNLGKGAAGSAVQCMNLMCGFDERAGLGFAGLHP